MSLLDAVRIGSQRPRLQHLPSRRAASAGREVVELASLAGLFLDDWQSWFLDNSLGEDEVHQWSAFEVALLVGRQNGKGSILEARQLAGLTILGEKLQVHTAHEFRTCYEHFLRMVNLVEACPDIDRQVQRIRRGAGEQAIEMRSGQRLRFLARSGGSGRGMSGDVVYLDEAFALTAPMMGALLPTLSARPNPQVWYTSSAPMAKSEVLHAIRRRAIEGKSDRLFFAEWSCEVGADRADVGNWYAANPALGVRISEEFIRSELDAMSGQPGEFDRERLGIPDMPESETPGPIDLEAWVKLADPSAVPASHAQWALAVSEDRRWSSLGVAGRLDDGRLCVGWREHKPGTEWIVPAAVAEYGKRRVPLRVFKGGPEGALIAPLREAGVEVVEVSAAEFAQATGQLIDAANAGRLVHLGQASLDRALSGAVLRVGESGASVWSQRRSSVEISPLVAVTVAAGGVPATAAVAYGFHDLDDY